MKMCSVTVGIYDGVVNGPEEAKDLIPEQEETTPIMGMASVVGLAKSFHVLGNQKTLVITFDPPLEIP